ncbi:hypothetical protein [Ferviditalea candida]|uniref:CARDB domain-containing protein n=1 Tax=Ferviditalea candida TaxID=3108399 RepID=A0ABU5ZQ00_9BACL|nr:hypothetical protein [Paenibacillaceae bacterium T2]
MRKIVVIMILLLPLYSFRTSAEDHPETKDDLQFNSSTESVSSLEITSSPKVELKTKPNSVSSGQVTVKNIGNTSVNLRIYVQDYSVDDGEVHYSDPDPDKPFASAAWFRLSDSEAVLAPQGYINLTYTVTTPPDASPGAHWAVIFFETVQVNKKKVNGGARIGATVINTVGGELIYKASVVNYQIAEWSKRKIPYSFQVENQGNVLLKVKPSLTVTSLGGSVNNIPLKEFTVYPNATNSVQGAWTSPSSFGIYDLNFKLDYYDSKSSEHFQQKVYIIPWHWILSGIGVMLVLWLRLRLIGSRRPRPGRSKRRFFPSSISSHLQPGAPVRGAEIDVSVPISRNRKKYMKKPRMVWWGYHCGQVDGYLHELDDGLHELIEEHRLLKEKLNMHIDPTHETLNVRLERKKDTPEEMQLKQLKRLLKQWLEES